MKHIAALFLICLIVASCTPATTTPVPVTVTPPVPTNTPTSTPGVTVTVPPITATVPPITSTVPPASPTATLPSPSATPQEPPKTGGIPVFDHIILIVLENEGYARVIGNPKMPYLNALAQQNVLLSNYFAVHHPSLPNYIALMSGSTQGINSDCTNCFINQPNLADRIEAGGRTWKSYLESMPSPCFIGDSSPYAQKHNPLIYFDSVRLDAARCARSIVPLTQLDADLSANQLPNFSFIMPNMCNSGHDCKLDVVDTWLSSMIAKLQASPALGQNSLIAVTFDEAEKDDTSSCCGMDAPAGGQVVTILVSPLARRAFNDNTAYSHYSMLNLILSSWNLPALNQSASAPQILAPWETQSGDAAKAPSSPLAAPAPTALSSSATPDAFVSAQSTAEELKFPIRAAFYYPWFPKAWKQQGLNPFSQYRPTLGYYSSDDTSVIQKQVAAMQYGKIQVGIASWWGQDHHTDGNISMLLREGEKAHFDWALYYEPEGQGDPSVEAIRADLEYIRNQYANSPAYLKIGGRFVIFAYSDQNDRCGMVDRWKEANTVGAYLVLRVFPGYQNCANQPDAWHQYAPATSQRQIGSSSFIISPGFFKAGEVAPRLARDLQQWNLAIQAMIASKANFQLITTFNEWGEGTAVESSTNWESLSGYGLYLDALHYDGNLPIDDDHPSAIHL